MSAPRKITAMRPSTRRQAKAPAPAPTAETLQALRNEIYQANQQLAQQLGALGVPVNHGTVNTGALTGVVEMAALVQILTVDLKLCSAELVELRVQEALHDILTRVLAARKQQSSILLPGAPQVPGDLKVN